MRQYQHCKYIYDIIIQAKYQIKEKLNDFITEKRLQVCLYNNYMECKMDHENIHSMNAHIFS